jgi:hypothetical protein
MKKLVIVLTAMSFIGVAVTPASALVRWREGANAYRSWTSGAGCRWEVSGTRAHIECADGQSLSLQYRFPYPKRSTIEGARLRTNCVGLETGAYRGDPLKRYAWVDVVAHDALDCYVRAVGLHYRPR